MLVTPSQKLHLRMEDTENDFLSFDGTDDYISISNHSSINLTKNFTLAAWVNIRDTSSDYGILSKLTDVADKQYLFEISSGELMFQYEYNNNNYLYSAGSISSLAWHFVAVTIDNSLNIELFVDGSSVGTDTAPAEVSSTTEPLQIGRIAGTYNSMYFDGLIDEVMIYDIALTESQIQDIYKSSRLAPTTNRVAYWKLDEGTGTTATDSAGSNDGTITGATWVTRVLDASGNWNHGTVTGASLTTGKFGQCFNFDGINDYIDIGINQSFSTSSVAFWLNWDNVGTDNIEFICEGDVGNNLMIHLGGDAGVNGIRWCQGTTLELGAYFDTLGIIQSGWNFYVLTYDGTTAYAYRNGSLINSANISFLSVTLSNFYIGSRTGASYFLDGLIDELMVFDKALSQADIKRVMLGLHPLNG